MYSKRELFSVIVLSLLVFFIAGYGLLKLKDSMPVYDIASVVTVTYEIVSVDPPKHYHVELRNITNGQIVNKRSKHCSGWAKYPVGTQILLIDVTYQQRNSNKPPFVVQADNWKSVICYQTN